MTLQPRTVFGTEFGARPPVPGFSANQATLLERSDIGCLLVNSAIDAAAVASALGAAGFAVPRQAGAVVDTPTHSILWLSPRSWLVQCPVGEADGIAERINAAFPDKRVHAALFTDYLCWFELSGVESAALLAEGAFISLERGGLPVGHAKRTVIAGVAAVVVRESEHGWLLGVERSRARYFADWHIAAARHLRVTNRSDPSPR